MMNDRQKGRKPLLFIHHLSFIIHHFFLCGEILFAFFGTDISVNAASSAKRPARNTFRVRAGLHRKQTRWPLIDDH
ncbi:MAG: hypothetical protein H0T45_12755 [Pyrinomonadaceae bacterium]|nr:hypothetical protein [Pyrinomonadaceae bacterium]